MMSRYFYKFLCILPWLWLAVFWLFVLRARLSLDRWPQPYRPDPQDLGFGDHALAIYTIFLGVVVGLLLWAGVAAKQRQNYAKGWIPFYLSGLGLVILMVLFDPGNFLEWFLD